MNRNILFFFSLLILTGAYSAAQTFTTAGTKLLDPNGNELILRGVNNPHAWHYAKSMDALEIFKELKMNSVRVVWQTSESGDKLKNVLKKSIENKLIPIVELHDATGDTTMERLMEMVAYYINPKIKKVLLPYDDKMLLNIANEWGTHKTSAEYWRDSYLQAIAEIRNAGYKAPIVIDGGGWGQDHLPILKYGNELIEADPLHNIVFSVHMYSQWNDPQKIETELQKLYDAGIPLMVGEFGYDFDKGYNNLECRVDHITIMRICQELGYGYLAWSWCGNNKVNAWLDMAKKPGWEDLTWWGRQVVHSEYGIYKNSKLASIFPEETEEELAARLKKEEKMARKESRLKKRNDKLAEQTKKRRELAKKRSEKLKEKADLQKEKQMKRLQEKREKKAERQKTEE